MEVVDNFMYSRFTIDKPLQCVFDNLPMELVDLAY